MNFYAVCLDNEYDYEIVYASAYICLKYLITVWLVAAVYF